MASERAKKAKDRGNKLFKDGKLADLLKHQTQSRQAERVDSTNPVYPSNLSAALYEVGLYADSINAILRSWVLKPEPALAIRLSTRLAKSLAHGIQDGMFNASVVQQNADGIKQLEDLSTKDAGAENVQAWKMWRSVRAGLEHHTDLSHEAKVRLSKMPIYKMMPDPHLTFWIFGTDDVISLLDGWGPNNEDRLNLRSFSKEHISQLSFLIAGVGDARHAFGTIIGLGKAREKLTGALKKGLRAHIMLLDIHFGTIARDLLLFLLIAHLHLHGWVIPSYCYDRLMKLCEDAKARLLEDPPRLPSWIHLDRGSIKPVIRALDYWLTDKSKTASGLLEHMTHVSSADSVKCMMSMGMMGMASIPGFDPMAKFRADAEDALRKIGDATLQLWLPEKWGAPKGTGREWIKWKRENREKLIALLVEMQLNKNMEYGLVGEELGYKQINAFVAPPELRERRHPEFVDIEDVNNLDDDKAQTKEFKKIGKTILKTWKPNITLLDGSKDGYMSADMDAFSIVRSIAAFNQAEGFQQLELVSRSDCPSFLTMSGFFRAVVETMKSLGGKLQVELIVGEICQELSKVRLGTDSRPGHFPKKFTRIWLSNIPDYTNGTLNTATYILPALQEDNSSVGANCLFNSPIWKSDDEYCYNYTLLLPKDLQRYLGVRTLNNKAIMDVLTLAPNPLPRPLASLASREHFLSWLTNLLVYHVVPGKAQPRPNTVKQPNNLVCFVRLLVELRNVGYPAHWLSEFLQGVLSGTLTTDRLAYKKELPRPVSEMQERTAVHRVRLDPWHAELEMILASARHGLPFAVNLPEGYASSVDNIGYFKASVVPNMAFGSSFGLPPQDNVVALLFYTTASELHPRSVDDFLGSLHAVVDGATIPPPGMFHIFTTQEFVDLNMREVRWRMSKSLAAKMRRERWSMVLWRMDFYVCTTSPCSAISWQNVDSPV
ncbi:unnamed protein product [Cyclocybe aegerita]|uniref:DUF4470 domain-containing protein n=1 Tax=Cyclocybe aegerita TaxID=1973307 RepID=A0A8S0Y0V3_CYCAE|nr:unnamed protein product [Cyclocybe aegerita]